MKHRKCGDFFVHVILFLLPLSTRVEYTFPCLALVGSAAYVHLCTLRTAVGVCVWSGVPFSLTLLRVRRNRSVQIDYCRAIFLYYFTCSNIFIAASTSLLYRFLFYRYGYDGQIEFALKHFVTEPKMMIEKLGFGFQEIFSLQKILLIVTSILRNVPVLILKTQMRKLFRRNESQNRVCWNSCRKIGLAQMEVLQVKKRKCSRRRKSESFEHAPILRYCFVC